MSVITEIAKYKINLLLFLSPTDHLMQNKDSNDLEVLNRILAQINTKLPHDLQTRLTPLHKVEILQYRSGENLLNILTRKNTM